MASGDALGDPAIAFAKAEVDQSYRVCFDIDGIAGEEIASRPRNGRHCDWFVSYRFVKTR